MNHADKLLCYCKRTKCVNEFRNDTNCEYTRRCTRGYGGDFIITYEDNEYPVSSLQEAMQLSFWNDLSRSYKRVIMRWNFGC